jgi:hypothetical protein
MVRNEHENTGTEEKKENTKDLLIRHDFQKRSDIHTLSSPMKRKISLLKTSSEQTVKQTNHVVSHV